MISTHDIANIYIVSQSSLRSLRCVLEQDTFTSEKVVVIPRKRWLHPDMTEKLFTWDVKQKRNIVSQQ